MSSHDANLSLPPRLESNTRASLEVRLESLCLTSGAAKQRIRNKPTKVFLRWWGQALSEGLYFSPRLVNSLSLRQDVCSSSARGIRVAVYKVVTGRKRFAEYLQDAERLFFELHTLGEKENSSPEVVGYAVLERLSRLIEVGIILEDLDLFDETGSLIGRLRCQLLYAPINDSSEHSSSTDSLGQSVEAKENPEVFTAQQKDFVENHEPSRQLSKIPLKIPSSSQLKPQREESHKNHHPMNSKPRVTFSDENLKPVNPDEVTSHDNLRDIPPQFPSAERSASVLTSRPAANRQSQTLHESKKSNISPVSNEPKGRVGTPNRDAAEKPEVQLVHPDVDIAASELVDELVGPHDVSQLRRFLLRSRDSKKSEIVGSESSEEGSADDVTEEKRQMASAKAAIRASWLSTSGQAVSRMPRRWKLSEERIKELSSVDHLVVCIRKVCFSPSFLVAAGSIKTSDSKSSRKRPNSARSSMPSASGDKVSYFVGFSLPPDDEEVISCSQKRDATSKTKNMDDVFFNHKSTFPIKFNETVLDIWFTQSINFKIYSRQLNQRTPTFLGESSIGLKHLLLTDRLSGGKEIKIAIFASKNFMREVSEHTQFPTSEIIGDLFVDFCFISNQNHKSTRSDLQHEHIRPATTLTSRYPLQQRAQEKRSRAVDTTNKSVPVLPSRASDGRALRKTVLTSKVHTDDYDQIPVKGPKASSLPSAKKASSSLFSVFMASHGRNFSSLRDPTIQNLFISCRFLGTGQLLTSPICWDIRRPNFNLRQVLPFTADDATIRSCKNNFLILEVWSVAAPKDKLVGIATIPLHPIFAAFENLHEPRDELPSPVFAVDNWLSVHDVLSSDVVGEIRLLFAVGQKVQIEEIIRQREEPQSSTTDNIASSISKRSQQKQRNESSDEVSHRTDQSCQTSMLFTKEEVMHEQSEGLFDQTENVKLTVSVKEARDLPRIKSREMNHRLPPNAYVTLPIVESQIKSSSNAVQPPTSSVVIESCCPVWNFRSRLEMSRESFEDSRQNIIIKVWHCPRKAGQEIPTSDKVSTSADAETECLQDLEHDPIIGFAAVDLSPLTLATSAFERISGWYNIMDFVGRVRGQINVTVEPVDVDVLKSLHIKTSETSWPCCNTSGGSGEEEDSVATCSLHPPAHSSLQVVQKVASPATETKGTEAKILHWQLPKVDVLDEDAATKSMLALKLSDLDAMAARLKERLNPSTSVQPEREQQILSGDTKTSTSHSKANSLSEKHQQWREQAETRNITTSLNLHQQQESQEKVKVSDEEASPNFIIQQLKQLIKQTQDFQASHRNTLEALPSYRSEMHSLQKPISQTGLTSDLRGLLLPIQQQPPIRDLSFTGRGGYVQSTSFPHPEADSLERFTSTQKDEAMPREIEKHAVPIRPHQNQPMSTQLRNPVTNTQQSAAATNQRSRTSMKSNPAAVDPHLEVLIELSDDEDHVYEEQVAQNANQVEDLLTYSLSDDSESELAAVIDENIDWSCVSPTSVAEHAASKRREKEDARREKIVEENEQQRRSRMAPDGGNPSELDTQ